MGKSGLSLKNASDSFMSISEAKEFRAFGTISIKVIYLMIIQDIKLLRRDYECRG